MIFKPFKIGDLIEAQGEIGAVAEISIFTTKLTGLSNKEIIIPNGTLSNGNIVNYTSLGTRRVDLVIGVSYDSDIKQTKTVLMDILQKHDLILKLMHSVNNEFKSKQNYNQCCSTVLDSGFKKST